ncbi:hypothetical protein L373_04205 [Klebsiella michiganensis]|uniref:Ead/Ea22-like family protein n=1 Tax=Klebsiella michiganensis TaxID=1134687 RepID=A0A7H5A4R4_9ENTR|nr:hypothetical protein [Klebsiella michiganensis]EWF84173.1 hypothetical protein L373_04205 [Klebsiella michiganensis]DAZ30514.1 MAG TPA: hypothetical protein [Caudoviricetes sp.]
MTDITELAQREKFEAWWEREYKHLESSKYTDAVPHIKYGFWMAYQAGGAELVEALDKSESRLHEVAVACATAEQALEKAQRRNGELETYSKTALEFREAARDENRHLKLELEIAEKRIAEQESKLANPVQLPKTNGYWTETEKAYEEAITLAKRQIRVAGFRCEGDE